MWVAFDTSNDLYKQQKKSIIFNLSALLVIKSQVHILHFLQVLTEFSSLT